MLGPRILVTCLAVSLLAGVSTAQEPATPSPSPAPVAAKATPVVADDQIYWSLKGGGELVGRLVKETPSDVFVDLGPTIVSLPLDSIVARESLKEALEKRTATEDIGTGSGVFDNSTGALIFRARSEQAGLKSRTEIVEDAKKSVVLITNPRAAGSGFVFDDAGRIITNHHVVDGEKYQTINLFRKRGTQWERVKIEDAEVEAYSTLFDIAIIKMDMKKVEEKGIELVPMPIAASRSLEVGDPVFAIGNPGMGGRLLEHSVSEGIVSSLARNFGDVVYIQTTAAVNPGNSGGPLVNDKGEVVGLVTLKASFQEGIAFALPVELILHFLRNSESYAFSEQAKNKGFRYLKPE